MYMEAMEKTKDKDEKSDETGSAKDICAHGDKYTARALVHKPNGCRKYGTDKRKTDKKRFF